MSGLHRAWLHRSTPRDGPGPGAELARAFAPSPRGHGLSRGLVHNRLRPICRSAWLVDLGPAPAVTNVADGITRARACSVEIRHVAAGARWTAGPADPHRRR